ncbi:hypothetical protein AA2016_6341 (plasmid) [Aminobacter aminovorans]|uniref:Uncharacterized protein n=1 Tax=Aminobacter aminovorans TaxID=83263 RepID=A0AAC8YVH1_AMIAI|nr:hypothetical protein AA2016_6341 [Aminobacter aminovorans]
MVFVRRSGEATGTLSALMWRRRNPKRLGSGLPRPLKGSPHAGARDRPSFAFWPRAVVARACGRRRRRELPCSGGRVRRPSQHEPQSEGPKWRSAPKGRNWRKTLVRAGQNGRPLTPVIQAKSFQCFMCLLVAKFGTAPDNLLRPLLSGRNVLAASGEERPHPWPPTDCGADVSGSAGTSGRLAEMTVADYVMQLPVG